MDLRASNPEERINNESNSCLSSLIPVIYGAVFSYSMYVLAQIILRFINAIDKEITSESFKGEVSDFFCSIIVYFTITIYMIQDVGSIIKIEKHHPFMRTTRYTLEFFIGLSYILTFTLLQSANYWSVCSFSLTLFLGGLWLNNLKEECEQVVSKMVIDHWKSRRNTHYIFASLCLLQFCIFLYFLQTVRFSWLNILIFLGCMLFLCVIYPLVLAHQDDKDINKKYCVNILLPDHWINKRDNQN